MLPAVPALAEVIAGAWRSLLMHKVFSSYPDSEVLRGSTKRCALRIISWCSRSRLLCLSLGTINTTRSHSSSPHGTFCHVPFVSYPRYPLGVAGRLAKPVSNALSLPFSGSNWRVQCILSWCTCYVTLVKVRQKKEKETHKHVLLLPVLWLEGFSHWYSLKSLPGSNWPFIVIGMNEGKWMNRFWINEQLSTLFHPIRKYLWQHF